MSDQTEPNPSKPLLYGWEIVTLIPSPLDDKKQVRASMIIAAPTIEDVWEYLALDRSDTATEIETIHRFGPILEVLGDQKGVELGSSSVGGSA